MAMAPMANVTDAAFRRMFVECGKPDVFWTEFVSVEGLLSKGRDRLLPDLWFSPGEHPIVAQIFGGKPEQFEEVAPLIKELGFDGVDINMGCPDRGVEKSGARRSAHQRPGAGKGDHPRAQTRRRRRPAGLRKNPARLQQNRRARSDGSPRFRRTASSADRPPPHPRRDVRRTRALGAGAANSSAPRPHLPKNRAFGQRRRPLTGRRPPKPKNPAWTG